MFITKVVKRSATAVLSICTIVYCATFIWRLATSLSASHIELPAPWEMPVILGMTMLTLGSMVFMDDAMSS